MNWFLASEIITIRVSSFDGYPFFCTQFSEHHDYAFQSSLFAGPYPVFYNLLFRHVRRAFHDLRTFTDYSRGKPTITYILIITYNKSFGASLIAKTATFCPHAPGNSRRIDPADSARSAVGGGGDGTAAAPSIRPPSLSPLSQTASPPSPSTTKPLLPAPRAMAAASVRDPSSLPSFLPPSLT